MVKGGGGYVNAKILTQLTVKLYFCSKCSKMRGGQFKELEVGRTEEVSKFLHLTLEVGAKTS